MTNPLKTVLYIGVTNSLLRRILEHKQHFNPKSFTSKYNLTKLIYFEMFETMYDAIVREKQLKRWRREWKESLISKVNNSWHDLSLEWDEMKSRGISECIFLIATVIDILEEHAAKGDY